jgi:hypothetical protein
MSSERLRWARVLILIVGARTSMGMTTLCDKRGSPGQWRATAAEKMKAFDPLGRLASAGTLTPGAADARSIVGSNIQWVD